MQVAVAQQIYDYVDQRIRRLDKDLKAFDAELTKDRVRQGLPVGLFAIVSHAQHQNCCCTSKLSDLRQTCICLGADCITPAPELVTLTPSQLCPSLLLCLCHIFCSVLPHLGKAVTPAFKADMQASYFWLEILQTELSSNGFRFSERGLTMQSDNDYT